MSEYPHVKCRRCGAPIPRGYARCEPCQHLAHVARGEVDGSCHDCAMAQPEPDAD